MNNKEYLKGWRTGRQIGKGSYGIVYEISREHDGNAEKCAIKVIEMPKSEEELMEYQTMYTEDELPLFFETQKNDVVKEFETMQKFSNDKHIVSFFEHSVLDKADRNGWTAVARMELLTPLTVYCKENVLTEKDVIWIGIDICSGLETLNKAGVVHRDIKYQNIFIDKEHNFKIGDFGTARSLDHTTMATKKGTPGFMAPEVYNNEPCNQTLDYYSVGLLLYWLLNERRLPFLPLPPAVPTVSQNESAISRRMAGEVLNRPKYGCDKLVEVIMKATSFNPKNRYASATEMKSDLLSIIRYEGLNKVVLDLTKAKNRINDSVIETATSSSHSSTVEEKNSIYKTKSVFSTSESNEVSSDSKVEETMSVFGSEKYEYKGKFFDWLHDESEQDAPKENRSSIVQNTYADKDRTGERKSKGGFFDWLFKDRVLDETKNSNSFVEPNDNAMQGISGSDEQGNFTDETVSVFSLSRYPDMSRKNVPISNDVYWGVSNSNTLTLSSRELLEREKTVASGMLINQGLEWQDYAEDIVRVIVKDPIQPIGHIQFMSFENCREMDLTFLNTEKITDMSYMFDGCSSLEKLDLTGFDTSNVTVMNDMFSECNELNEVLLSSFDTSNVENMDGMFYQCSSLKKLDLRNFDTENVEYMNRMFSGCKKLVHLDLSSFDTGNVEDMGYMFSECYKLKRLDLSGFDISRVDDHIGMFYGTMLTVHNTGLRADDEEKHEAVIGNMSGEIYWGISSDYTLYLSSTILPERESTVAQGLLKYHGEEWKNYAGSIVRVVVKDSIVPVSKISFSGFSKCISMDLRAMRTERITDMSGMFRNCVNLEKLDVLNFDTTTVKYMTEMFAFCDKLLELNLSSFNTSSVTDMSGMFSGCRLLNKINVGSFNTANVKYMSNMFNGCRCLKSVDISSFDRSGSVDKSGMFDGCIQLTDVDLTFLL